MGDGQVIGLPRRLHHSPPSFAFIRSRSFGSTPPPSTTRYRCAASLARLLEEGQEKTVSDQKRPENDQIKMILELIKEKPHISRSEILHKMGLHESSVKRRLKMMVDKGVIQRIGSDKGVIGKLNNSILIMKCKIETSNGIMFLKGIDGDKRLEIADFILMEHVAKLQEIRDYDNF